MRGVLFTEMYITQWCETTVCDSQNMLTWCWVTWAP